MKRRQMYGIIGMVCAVAGGAAWFFNLYTPAFILWGIAVLILWRLKKRTSRKH
jgi:4-hydroxybenzoate polyprenyltransferase